MCKGEVGNKNGFLTWLCPKFYTPHPDLDIPDALTRQSQKTTVRAMEKEYKQVS